VARYTVANESTISGGLAAMDKGGIQAIAVVDAQGKFVGIVTDGDIRRHFLNGDGLGSSIGAVTNTDPITLSDFESGAIEKCFAEKNINHIPIVRADQRLVGLAVRLGTRIEEERVNIPVVVMAGGKGTRMAPLSNIIPKPLFPVGHNTMLEKIFDTYSVQGFHDFRVVINYKRELIKSYFSELDHDYQLEFLEEADFYGTVGGLVQFKSSLPETFFLTNCDVLTDADYRSMLAHHREAKAEITILGLRKKERVAYGVVNLDEANKVEGLSEKPEYSNIIMTGIYLVERSALELIPKNREVGMDLLINSLLEKGRTVSCYVIDDGWYDIGQFDEYKKLLAQMS